jgi:hypothetical protein
MLIDQELIAGLHTREEQRGDKHTPRRVDDVEDDDLGDLRAKKAEEEKPRSGRGR